jgi:hypothetical protein
MVRLIVRQLYPPTVDGDLSEEVGHVKAIIVHGGIIETDFLFSNFKSP